MSILARLYQIRLEKKRLSRQALIIHDLIYVFLTATFTGRTGAKRLILNVQNWTAPKEEHLSTMVSSFQKAWLLTS